jgi:urate oxidase
LAIVLGANAYGKAECRVVRIVRNGARHEIRDRNVSTSLHGDFAAAHIEGDQARVLPTDTQKNTVYAFAKDLPEAEPEELALALARHFVTAVAPVAGARVAVEEYAWDRATVGGAPHDHTFLRRGQEVRTTHVTVDDRGGEWVVSGFDGLVLLKSTGSEFRGFLEDGYTTLQPTDDRIMATSLDVRWRHLTATAWASSYDGIRTLLVERYAEVHSRALQQTLWEMGRAVLEQHEDVAEIRLSAPNRHHFVVDLAPFGRDNANEVFFAADRPYGLICATVRRDDVPCAEIAWDAWPPRAAGGSPDGR